MSECVSKMVNDSHGEVIDFISKCDWGAVERVVMNLSEFISDTTLVLSDDDVRKLHEIHGVCAASLQGFKSARRFVMELIERGETLEVYDSQGQKITGKAIDGVKKSF